MFNIENAKQNGISYLMATFTSSLDDIAFYDFVSESGKWMDKL